MPEMPAPLIEFGTYIKQNEFKLRTSQPAILARAVALLQAAREDLRLNHGISGRTTAKEAAEFLDSVERAPNLASLTNAAAVLYTAVGLADELSEEAVAVPTRPCSHCPNPIEPEQRRVTRTLIDAEGQAATYAWHIECARRWALDLYREGMD